MKDKENILKDLIIEFDTHKNLSIRGVPVEQIKRLDDVLTSGANFIEIVTQEKGSILIFLKRVLFIQMFHQKNNQDEVDLNERD